MKIKFDEKKESEKQTGVRHTLTHTHTHFGSLKLFGLEWSWNRRAILVPHTLDPIIYTLTHPLTRTRPCRSTTYVYIPHHTGPLAQLFQFVCAYNWKWWTRCVVDEVMSHVHSYSFACYKIQEFYEPKKQIIQCGPQKPSHKLEVIYSVDANASIYWILYLAEPLKRLATELNPIK